MQQRLRELEEIVQLWQQMNEEERQNFWRRVLHEVYAAEKVALLASQESPPRLFEIN